MPKKLGKEATSKIIRMRAMDYNKQEIADKLNISRTTVNRRLEEFREMVEAKNEVDALIEEVE